MSDPLYERYKEALRTGHVAVLRGRLDEAIAAYRVAVDVAPERALPHTSLGGVLLDLGRADEALAEFGAALESAPADEGALLGRSEALVRLGQPIAAAESLDALADVFTAAGRDGDAVETLQRALVLEERGGRRRRFQRALRTLRMTTGDRASDEALGRALGLLDAPRAAASATATGPGPGAAESKTEAEHAGSAREPEAEAEHAEPARESGAQAEAAPQPDPNAGSAAAAWAAVGWPVEAHGAERPEAPPEEPVDVPADLSAEPSAELATVPPVMPPVPVEPRFAGEAFVASALDALDGGDGPAALVAYRDAARTFLEAGLLVAALDACREALRLGPGDVDVHLLYAAVFRAHGWHDLATQRVVDLVRLVDLGGDAQARARISLDVATVHADDERLAALRS